MSTLLSSLLLDGDLAADPIDITYITADKPAAVSIAGSKSSLTIAGSKAGISISAVRPSVVTILAAKPGPIPISTSQTSTIDIGGTP